MCYVLWWFVWALSRVLTRFTACGWCPAVLTLAYSPLALLFGILRGIGSAEAENTFDDPLTLRCFTVLDSLLKRSAHDGTAKFSTSASVQALNLGSFRAVLLLVRVTRPLWRAVPCCPSFLRDVSCGAVDGAPRQILHKLVRPHRAEGVSSRYVGWYSEAERQFQGTPAVNTRCAALKVMIRTTIVCSKTAAVRKEQLLALLVSTLRAAAVQHSPSTQLMDVLLKGLIELCHKYADITPKAMSTLVRVLLDQHGAMRTLVGSKSMVKAPNAHKPAALIPGHPFREAVVLVLCQTIKLDILAGSKRFQSIVVQEFSNELIEILNHVRARVRVCVCGPGFGVADAVLAYT